MRRFGSGFPANVNFFKYSFFDVAFFGSSYKVPPSRQIATDGDPAVDRFCGTEKLP